MVTSRSLPTGGSEAHHTAREGPHGVALAVRGVDRARTKPKPKTRAKGRGPRKILAPSKMVSGGGPVARQGQALRVPLRVPLTRSVGGRSRRSRVGAGARVGAGGKTHAPQGIRAHGQYGQSRQRSVFVVLYSYRGGTTTPHRKGRKRNENPSCRRVSQRAGDNARPERGTVGRGVHPRRHCPAGVRETACPPQWPLLRCLRVHMWELVQGRSGRSLKG